MLIYYCITILSGIPPSRNKNNFVLLFLNNTTSIPNKYNIYKNSQRQARLILFFKYKKTMSVELNGERERNKRPHECQLNFLFVSVENSTGYPTVRRRRVTALYFAHVLFQLLLRLDVFYCCFRKIPSVIKTSLEIYYLLWAIRILAKWKGDGDGFFWGKWYFWRLITKIIYVPLWLLI